MTTFIGRTIDEAIQEGLSALHVEKKDVKIKLIQKARRGFLGIGKRDAKVEMTVVNKPTPEKSSVSVESSESSSAHVAKSNPQPVEKSNSARDDQVIDPQEKIVKNLIQYLGMIVTQLGIDAEIKVVHQSHKNLKLEFKTNEEGLLIGKHGLTINALQALSEIYLNRMGIYHLAVELDTANYRQRRMEVLQKLAERTAREVVANGQPVYLDPMPSFERKRIHKTLEDSTHVRTYSAGREPHRAVVVAPR